ncbi:calcium/proton exchanger [Linderina pennispora]|uniref:Calcium/proton exchanger n=1 Tax=Linderina pennispora TaxID=61395 RepID=A0A1Y1WAS8_9FUNG|nr:calcium/proton exchanger [Linderina pennispora]ORX70336.1 calcium/proton exchanger [Linderina pennispora]
MNRPVRHEGTSQTPPSLKTFFLCSILSISPLFSIMPVFSNLLRQRSTARSLHSQAPIVPPTHPRHSTSNSEWGLGARASLSRTARHPSPVRTNTMNATANLAELTATQHEKCQPAGLLQPMLLLRRSLFNSWINILLLLVPVGIASHPAGFPDVAVFIINFFAIVPLASLLGYATEQLALHLGETLGGLLNATFGNAVELLVSILALVKGEVEIVQTSLVGSILSNLLLVGGCCFFFGGLKNNEQLFNVNAAQSYGSLLAMAILSTLLPAAYNSLEARQTELKSGTLTLSHVTSIFLLIIYIAYLVFQLKTHAGMFVAVDKAEKDLAALKPHQREATAQLVKNDGTTVPATPSAAAYLSPDDVQSANSLQNIESHDNVPDDDEEDIELTIPAALLLLLIITGLTGVCAEFLVDSIDGLTTKWNLSRAFVGMILLPIVGNAAEHVTAVTVAIRNKMDLAIGVAVGSSLQIALFVTPFMCVLGWIIKQPMTIYFSPFTTVVLFVTVLLVNYIIGDGRTNWLEGLVLIVAYVIIGVAYFLYPKDIVTG